MAGRDSPGSCRFGGTADYKEEEHSNPVNRSFIASFGVALIRGRRFLSPASVLWNLWGPVGSVGRVGLEGRVDESDLSDASDGSDLWGGLELSELWDGSDLAL